MYNMLLYIEVNQSFHLSRHPKSEALKYPVGYNRHNAYVVSFKFPVNVLSEIIMLAFSEALS